MSLRISRRTLLRGAGGVAMALPLLDAMAPSARGGGAAPSPRRIVFMFTPNGFPMAAWKCAVNATESTDFSLSPILSPLADVRSDCTFIEGLGYESSYDPQGHAGAHEAGASSMLTGSWAGPGDQFGGDGLLAGYAVSESVDHTLMTELGGATKFPAYYFGVHPTVGALSTRMFYAGPDQPISPIYDPLSVWQSVFSELGLESEELARLTAHRKLVLDAVSAEAKALRCKLGSDDRARLDAHLTNVEELAAHLDAAISNNPACVVPAAPSPPNIFSFDDVPTLAELHTELMVLMLACDLTRVVGFQWVSPGAPGGAYSWLGQTTAMHEMSHDNTATSNAQLAEINAWYAGRFRDLILRLKATPDGAGQTLFDSTLLVWASECGNPWVHDRHDVAWTLGGSAAGYFKTGRYFKFPSATPHNRLLLSLLDAMGAPRTSFGGPAYGVDGPLASLRA